MANALYDLAKQKFLDALLDLPTLNLKVVLVDTATYSVNLATDEFLSIIPTGEQVATSANLGTKSIALGVFDAADITFSAVSGDPCEALVIFNDTTVAATSDLIAYIDTATNLPVTPNGGDITVQWDSGANKIFAL